MRIASLLLALGLLQVAAIDTAQQTRSGPSIRIYNASQSDSKVKLDLWIDDALAAGGVQSASLSGPFKGAPKTKLVIKKQDALESLLEVSLDSSVSDHIVVLTGSPDEQLDYADLAIRLAPVPNEQPQLSVLNDTPKDTVGGNLDVYVLKDGNDLNTSMPEISDSSYKGQSTVTIAPGKYTICVTKSGSKDILVQSDKFDVSVQGREAALIIPGASGNPRKVVLVSIRKGNATLL